MEGARQRRSRTSASGSCAPFIHFQAMAVWRGESEAILVQGVDAVAEQKVSVINQFIKQGSFAALSDEPTGIVLGKPLAKALALRWAMLFH